MQQSLSFQALGFTGFVRGPSQMAAAATCFILCQVRRVLHCLSDDGHEATLNPKPGGLKRHQPPNSFSPTF